MNSLSIQKLKKKKKRIRNSNAIILLLNSLRKLEIHVLRINMIRKITKIERFKYELLYILFSR